MRHPDLKIPRRLSWVAIGACAATLAWAPAALAMTLGSLAPANSPIGETCTGCHGFQTKTAAGSPSYAVPAGKWRITSWRSRNTTRSGVRAQLWVFRHTRTNGQYKLVARSRKERITAGSAPRFATDIPVRRGELLGLATFGEMIFSYISAPSRDVSASPECNVPLGRAVGSGTSCSLFSEGNGRVNVAAVLHKRRR